MDILQWDLDSENPDYFPNNETQCWEIHIQMNSIPNVMILLRLVVGDREKI